jgi:hypothetical protein
VLIWTFDIIWTTLCCVTLWCAILVYLMYCPNCIHFWFLKVLCMHIFYVLFRCMISFFDPIYRLNSIHSLLANMCMEFIFMSICTYSRGVCPMYVCSSNSWVPMSLGTILCVNVDVGTLEMHWRIVSFKEGGVTMCLLESC